MVKLIIEDDEGKTTVVPLIRDEITIGRKEGNTIRLTERNVSRKHAKLIKQNGAIFIEDLNSYNGIKVNGNKIAGRVAVAEGDRIQIGDYVLGLKVEGVVEAEKETFTPAQTVKLPRASSEATTAQIDSQATNAAVEAADTALPAPAPEEATAAALVGRLVCVSNNFPGQEWILDKPIAVIGRTEDNDVVVNHRSISRHHARVTEENGRYTIIDLQSSNGVRINGEEYGKVELRRGDLIDLGHVRLRFVAPGEDFVFSRDASVVDISKGGKSFGGIWFAVIAVAVLVVGFVVYKIGTSEETPGGGGSADVHPAGDTDAQRVGPATGPDPAELVAKISRAVASEQWDDALKACDQLTGEAKVSAQTNCAKATMEKGAYELFEKANSASVENKYRDVIRFRKLIPSESVYKTRDLKVLENARTKYLAQARKNLEEMVRAKDCAKADVLAKEIKEVDPADTDAEARARACRAGVAVVPKKPRPKPQPKPKPKPKPKPQPGMQALQQAMQLLKQAEDAYMAGNHRRSITLARQVLKVRPGHYKAIQILGASACYLKQKATAQWAYDRVKIQYRPLLKNICNRTGVVLQ